MPPLAECCTLVVPCGWGTGQAACQSKLELLLEATASLGPNLSLASCRLPAIRSHDLHGMWRTAGSARHVVHSGSARHVVHSGQRTSCMSRVSSSMSRYLHSWQGGTHDPTAQQH